MDEAQERDPGIAGRSASREAERRHERLQNAQNSRSRIANAFLGPTEQQKRLATEEKHWATGARGEEMLAEALAGKCPAAALLHDRRIPKSRANMDHIAVTSTGVYVIDAKRYRGKIEVRSPLFGKPKLVIAGRDRTKLVEGLERQVAVVRTVLAEVASGVPVQGCFCFVAPEGLFADVGLPVMRTLKINGLPLYSVRRLSKRLNTPGAFTRQEINRICEALTRQLPPA
jgi:Nuclease-related domain